MYTEFAQFNVALLVVLGNKVFFLYSIVDMQMRNSNLPFGSDVGALRGTDSFSACSRQFFDFWARLTRTL
jgi:hypothetical protein